MNINNKGLIAVIVVYILFFTLIGGSMYYFNSMLPLWALLLLPPIRTISNIDDDGSEDMY